MFASIDYGQNWIYIIQGNIFTIILILICFLLSGGFFLFNANLAGLDLTMKGYSQLGVSDYIGHEDFIKMNKFNKKFKNLCMFLCKKTGKSEVID